MEDRFKDQLSNCVLSDMSQEEILDTCGGDGITEAVFWALGYWAETYSTYKLRTVYVGQAGFI